MLSNMIYDNALKKFNITESKNNKGVINSRL